MVEERRGEGVKKLWVGIRCEGQERGWTAEGSREGGEKG